MKVLVAAASYITQYVESIAACFNISREPQDELDIEWMKRGDIARERFANRILGDDSYGPEDALLLLDADQKHPIDMLERMRRLDVDMVCAHYYARDADKVESMCFVIGDGKWPFKPYDNPPRTGLHRIALTGFGCVLIKKKVLQAVRDVTPKGAKTMETDFVFFYRAYQLGYDLWLDADIESEHAVTLWLNHDTAERLKK